MATYKVTAADGTVLRVEAPEGSSPDAVRALARQQLLLQLAGGPFPEPEPEPGFFGEVGKGLASGMLGLVETAATGAAQLLPQSMEPGAREAIAKWGEAVQAPFAPHSEYADSWTRKISSGLGSTVPFLAAAPFGLAGLAAGAGLGVAAGSGEAVQRAAEAGATEDEIGQAAMAGVIPGALEMVAPARIFNRARGILKAAGPGVAEAVEATAPKLAQAKTRMKYGQRVAEGALEEGAQEAAAEILQNLIQRGIYDPEQGVFTGTGESATIGAVVGAIMAAALPGRPMEAPEDTSDPAQPGATIPASAPSGAQGDMFDGTSPPAVPVVPDVGDIAPTPIERVRQQPDLFVEADLNDMQRQRQAQEEARKARDFDRAVQQRADQEVEQAELVTQAATPTQRAPTAMELAMRQAQERAAAPPPRPAPPEPTAPTEPTQQDMFPVRRRDQERAERETTPLRELLQSVGITRRYPVYRRIADADLARPEERERVQRELTTFAQQMGTTPVAGAARQVAASPLLRGEPEVVPQGEQMSLVGPRGGIPRGALPKAPQRRPPPPVEVRDEPSVDEQADPALVGAAPQESAVPQETIEPEEAVDAAQAPKAEPVPVGPEEVPQQPAAPEAVLTPEELADIEALRQEMQVSSPDTSLPQRREQRVLDQARELAPEAFEPFDTDTAEAYADAIEQNFGQPITPEQRKFLIRRLVKAKTAEDAYNIASNYLAGLADAKRESPPAPPEQPAGRFTGDAAAPVSPEERQAEEAEAAEQRTAPPETPQDRADAVEAARGTVFGRPESDPLSTYFTPNDTVDTGISRLVEDHVYRRTEKTKAAYEAARKALPQDKADKLSRDFAAEAQQKRAMERFEFLPTNMVSSVLGKLPERVHEAFLAEDFKAGMELLTQVPDKNVSAVAKALLQAVPGLKIKYATAETDALPDDMAGAYDPATDTVLLNPRRGGVSVHTVLHEVTHAAVHKILQNPAHPLRRQLQAQLDIVQKLSPTAYGATSLEEFVVEAFSNPEFKAQISAMRPDGSRISVWEQVANRIMNMLRRLMGRDTKSPESVKTAMDKLLYSLLMQNPATPDGTVIRDALAAGKSRSILDMLYDENPGNPTLENLRAIRAALGDLGRRGATRLMDALPLRTVVDIVQDVLPVAPRILDAINTHEGTKAKLYGQIITTKARLTDALRPHRAQREAFNSLIQDSTIAEVDPALDRKAATDKYGNDPEKMATYETLRKRYSNLAPAVQGAYRELRDAYRTMYDQMLAAINTRLDTLEMTPEARATLKSSFLNKLTARAKVEPYFPLMRKGDYWLSYHAPSPDGTSTELYIEAFEKPGARQKAMDRLRNTDGVTEVQEYSQVNQIFSHNQRVPSTFLYQLASVFNGSPPPDVLEVILRAMPESSFTKSFQHRQGYYGAEHDAISVFGERGASLATQIANLQAAPRYNALERELQEQANLAASDPNVVPYADSLRGYIDFARNPRIHPIARNMKMLSFWATLGLNVSSVVVNATNLPVVTLPFLGGRYGMTEAAKAMAESIGQYGRTAGRRQAAGIVPGTARDQRSGPSLDNLDYNDPELPEEFRDLKVLTEVMAKYGELHRSYTAEILDMDNPDSAPVRTWVNHAMGFMFHHGERANRQISAMAAYKLELARLRKDNKKGRPDAELQREAAEYAVEAAERTNSGALITTAPRLAQNSIGTVAMMYKRFGISMMALQARMAAQALMGADKATRAEALRQIAGLFATSGILAGVAGMPMYGVVSMLYNTLLQDDDEEDFDTLAAQFFGEGLYSGGFNALTGLDIGPRIGMTNLIWRSQPNREQDSMILKGLELLGGPFVGVASRIEDGIQLMSEGQVQRGLERALPAAFGNIGKALRYSAEGATTLRGDPVVEDLTWWSEIGQAMGFAPAEYTRKMEQAAMIKRIDRRVNEKRSKLLRDWYIAMSNGDTDSVREAQAELMALGERHPGAAVSAAQIRASLRQHHVTSAVARKYGGVTINKNMQAEIDAILAKFQE